MNQLNAAAAVRAWWPVLMLVPVVGWAAAPFVRLRQRARQSAVVFYEVDDESARWFQALLDDWSTLSRSAGLWRLISQGAINSTYQRKVNAGAGSLVKRLQATISTHGPRVLVTNIAVPTVQVGRESLHFLPDRVLLRSGRRFSDVSYEQIETSCTQTRFIESGRVPRDATRVGTTWQYANVKGGPDRRYKNNRQLPILGYAELTVSSQTGLRWIVQCSNLSSAQAVGGVLQGAKAPVHIAGPAGVTTKTTDGCPVGGADPVVGSGALQPSERPVVDAPVLSSPAVRPAGSAAQAAPAAHSATVGDSPPVWIRRVGAWTIDFGLCCATYLILIGVLIGVVGGKQSSTPPWLSAIAVALAPVVPEHFS